MMPTMTADMNQLPQHLISHGTALNNTIRQVAGSIGTTILVTIMTQQTTEHLAKSITTSTIDGSNDAFLFATLLVLIVLLFSFFLRTPKVNREK
ncbi:multidrug resistance protein [Priestia megaterium]|uniref:multidrug resistance protein n=1 Tax=Priestia megaterium TaxID=1404 RepID=UPI0026E27663|nr:multidrug resistance protein [Priestia megaterium]MDO6849344.1 multidrug resistance protein [Priestia megaterium]